MGSHNKAAVVVAAHEVKTTGVHGVGESTVCSETEAGTIAAALIAAQGLTVAETQVHSGQPPTSWTDLNLSGAIGAQAALVLVKVYNPHSSSDYTYAFRRNGDGDNSFNVGNFNASSGQIVHLSFGFFIAVTDPSGIVEWRAEAASGSGTTVDVVAYLK
jgi:hypothetical protein